MAEKSGFFNALVVDNAYDRTYNADDYCDNLAVVINNGVYKETNGLTVTASGLTLTVATGRAWIEGHYYLLDAAKTFTVPTAPTVGKRYDRIMLRLNKAQATRSISLVYVEGTAATTPTKPSVTRSGDIYDLALCDIYVDTNATSVTLTDLRSDATVCGWVYSVKDIVSLQSQLDAITWADKFVYKCTGIDDNIALSEIAQAIYNGSYTVGSLTAAAESFLTGIGGNTFLSAMPSDAQIEIDVVGRLGATTPAYGDGTSSSRYRWFNIGIATVDTKRIIFDFAKCEKIDITCAMSTSNIIFYGSDMDIRNANVDVEGEGTSSYPCNVTMLTGNTRNGYIYCEACRFVINASGSVLIADNGTFTDCYCNVKSRAYNSYCFAPASTGLIVLNGGTFYAYNATSAFSSYEGVVIYLSSATAAVLAQSINAPVVASSGMSQDYFVKATAGKAYINGYITTLTNSIGSDASVSATGKIELSKR